MLFCRYQQLPAALTQRVLAYLKYKWLRTHGLNERKVLAELPPKLSQDVNLELYKDLIEAVPLFRGVEKGFIKAIVKCTMGRVSDGAPHTHRPTAHLAPPSLQVHLPGVLHAVGARGAQGGGGEGDVLHLPRQVHRAADAAAVAAVVGGGGEGAAGGFDVLA